MEAIDRKFFFQAWPTKEAIGRRVEATYTEANAVVFLAKDVLLVPLLEYYLRLCGQYHVDDAQTKGVRLLIGRVETWQKANLDKLKLPDVDPGPEADRVCAPNE